MNNNYSSFGNKVFKPLLDYKILALSKLKAFADAIPLWHKWCNSSLEGHDTSWAKGENVVASIFSFPTTFLKEFANHNFKFKENG